MKQWIWQSIAFVCLAVLGYIAVSQVQTYLVMETAAPGVPPRLLGIRLQEIQRQNVELRKWLTVLQEQLQNPSLTREKQAVRGFAGLEPLSGPGVKIILQDRKKRKRGELDDVDRLVHVDYVIGIVNELRLAGARGIAVGNQETGIWKRITAWTGFVCNGATISVGGQPLTLPITILAVGAPSGLYGMMYQAGSTYLYYKKLRDLPWHAFRESYVALPGAGPPPVARTMEGASD